MDEAEICLVLYKVRKWLLKFGVASTWHGAFGGCPEWGIPPVGHQGTADWLSRGILDNPAQYSGSCSTIFFRPHVQLIPTSLLFHTGGRLPFD